MITNGKTRVTGSVGDENMITNGKTSATRSVGDETMITNGKTRVTGSVGRRNYDHKWEDKSNKICGR